MPYFYQFCNKSVTEKGDNWSMDIQDTPTGDQHADLKKYLAGFFSQIDKDTDKVLDLMREKGFSREGLQMVMLGLPHEFYLNGKAPKKIDHGTLGEIDVDIKRRPGPRRNYNVVNLKILDKGITEFLTLPDPHSDEEKAHLDRVTHSTVNEIALYKALAQTARRALGIDKTEEQEKTVQALDDALAQLEHMAVSAITFSPELPFSLWKEHIAQRVEVYEKHFQAKRAKSQVTEANTDGIIILADKIEERRRSGIQ